MERIVKVIFKNNGRKLKEGIEPKSTECSKPCIQTDGRVKVNYLSKFIIMVVW